MKKNRYHRKFGPILSETFSSDVIRSILSSPTDTLQALNESDLTAKIKNTTQSAKNKIKKFYNGDFSIRYNGTFAEIRQDLRKLLSLNLEGRSDYAVYETPNGKLAFRLTDHNANGNNFEQDEAETNISVYVAFEEYEHVETKIHYKEYKIMPEVFNAKRVECINAIIRGVSDALQGDEFEIDDAIAKMTEYNQPIDSEEVQDNDGNNNIKTENYMRNNKRTIRLTESDLHRVIKESVKRVLREGQVENNKPYFGKVSYLDDPKGHIDGYLQPGEFDYNQSLDRDAIRHMPHFKNGRNENGWLDDESMEQLNNYRQAFDKHQERSLQKMQPQPSLKDRIQAKKSAKRQEDEAFQEFVYHRTRGLIPSDLSEEEYIDLWREFAREY